MYHFQEEDKGKLQKGQYTNKQQKAIHSRFVSLPCSIARTLLHWSPAIIQCVCPHECDSVRVCVCVSRPGQAKSSSITARWWIDQLRRPTGVALYEVSFLSQIHLCHSFSAFWCVICDNCVLTTWMDELDRATKDIKNKNNEHTQMQNSLKGLTTYFSIAL